MGPTLYRGDFFDLYTVLRAKQWDHGTKIIWEGFLSLYAVLCIKQWDHGNKIIWVRLFQIVYCTSYKAMGPWDQDNIGESFSIDAINYIQCNGTMGPRLY
jgi:hypothetical protein